jgi:hypothetical protein
LIADAAKSRLEVNPVAPEHLARLVTRAYQLLPAVVQRITSLQAPVGKLAKVKFKTVRATLGKRSKKGGFAITTASGKRESIKLHPRRSKVKIGGKKAKAKALKPGMNCTIAYLGNKTIAKSVTCD